MTIHCKPVHKGVTGLPADGDPGAFGAIRKHDTHTGIDIYCDKHAVVYAIENGVVTAVEAFTGAHADSPWWNNTWAVFVEGESGVVVYGEIKPAWWIETGYQLGRGEQLGIVIPVLKEDKGVNPTSMLHFELYRPGTTKSVWWHHGEERPEELLDPTELLRAIYE